MAITPGVDVNGVWISPISELIEDELAIWANVAQISSIRIPGYWIHEEGSTIRVAAPPMPGEKVVYALHGGAYILFSAHPTDPTADIARGLVKHVDSVHRVLSPEYRLSSGSGSQAQHSFPTALIDALAGYVYLVETVGFDPSDIIVEGDSAGGNLALALTRYLVEHPDSGFPAPPGALVLLSPWSDLGPQFATPYSSWSKNSTADYISMDRMAITVGSFVGPHGSSAAETNLMISPASMNPAISMKIRFRGFPRTFIAAGGAEVFYDMHCVLKDRMIRDLGEGDGVRAGDGKVRFYVAEDATHDWVCIPPNFEPEKSDTLKAISAWIAASDS